MKNLQKRMKEKMKNKGFFIADGAKVVLSSAALTLVLFLICNTLGVLAAAITLFLGYIFRNDSRYIFANSRNILSPVDAVVSAIDADDKEYKIYCKVSLLGSRKVLAPIEGKLDIKRVQRGLNLDPNSFKASLLNEQVQIELSNEVNLKKVGLKLIAGKYSNAVDITSNEDISQGEAIATLVDGIVVVTLPKDETLNIKIGEKLKAGQTNLVA